MITRSPTPTCTFEGAPSNRQGRFRVQPVFRACIVVAVCNVAGASRGSTMTTGLMHWKLVLLARKFAMAVVAIMLDYNPLFQV